jgi:hypothetical protein
MFLLYYIYHKYDDYSLNLKFKFISFFQIIIDKFNFLKIKKNIKQKHQKWNLKLNVTHFGGVYFMHMLWKCPSCPPCSVLSPIKT